MRSLLRRCGRGEGRGRLRFRSCPCGFATPPLMKREESALDSGGRRRLRSVVLGARVSLASLLPSPRPRSGQFRDRGAVNSATAERSIPRPRGGQFRDRGAVDEIAVGRARASATSLRDCGAVGDRGAVDEIAVGRARASATSLRDCGAVDEIAVGRARASATSLRVTRGTAAPAHRPLSGRTAM